MDPNQESDQENDGRPTGCQAPTQKIAGHDENQIEQTEQNGDQPQLRCQPDGCDGKGKRGVEGQLQHLEQGVFGSARRPVGRIEKDKGAFEADPRNHSPQEPVAFGQPPQRPVGRAGEQAKVTGTANGETIDVSKVAPAK